MTSRLSRKYLRARSPSSFGMTVYRDLMSIVKMKRCSPRKRKEANMVHTRLQITISLFYLAAKHPEEGSNAETSVYLYRHLASFEQ